MNVNGCQKLQQQPQPPGNRPKHQPGQLRMWGAHPTLNLAPPFVVKECGRTQNVEAIQRPLHH